MAGRVTQVVVEVLRGTDAADARVSQLVVEVLSPYIDLSITFFKASSSSFTLTPTSAGVLGVTSFEKAASNALTLTAAASESSTGFAEAAANSFTLTAVASESGALLLEDASSSIVLTATAAEVLVLGGAAGASAFVLTATASALGVFGEAATSLLILSHPAGTPVGNVGFVAPASNRLVFRVRARTRVPDLVFGDEYLGRFQVGQEVPLWVVVRDARGAPAVPTAGPPTAVVYNLETGARVEAVELQRLRGSRDRSVHARGLRLSADYVPGRHGVLYRVPAGGFVGVELALFEVDAGGDAAGPVHAAHAVDHPAGLQLLAQTGSGALALGRLPRVP